MLYGIRNCCIHSFSWPTYQIRDCFTKCCERRTGGGGNFAPTHFPNFSEIDYQIMAMRQRFSTALRAWLKIMRP